MFRLVGLFLTCKSCKKDSSLKIFEVSRMELENEIGTEFEFTCKHCAIRKEYHVNDVRAEKTTPIIMIVFLGIFILAGLSTYLLFNIGIISTVVLIIPAAIYLIILKSQENTIHTFNKNRITRSTAYIPKNKKIL